MRHAYADGRGMAALRKRSFRGVLAESPNKAEEKTTEVMDRENRWFLSEGITNFKKTKMNYKKKKKKGKHTLHTSFNLS